MDQEEFKFPEPDFSHSRFNGPFYDPEFDDDRLSKQIGRVYSVMICGAWRTLREIEELTGDPQASISAQLRHLRKERFGSYIVELRNRGNRENGLFEYRLLSHPEHEEEQES